MHSVYYYYIKRIFCTDRSGKFAIEQTWNTLFRTVQYTTDMIYYT